MFWDNVAGVYDVFVNIINGKTHRALRQIVEGLIEPGDDVLECVCLRQTVTGSFLWKQDTKMCRSRWLMGGFPALLP